MAVINGKITLDNLVRNDWHDDWLVGTTSDDMIQGLGGNDTIFAGLGNDTIHAGNGTDTIYAQSSAPYGGAAAFGNDTAYGDGGNDTLDYSLTTSWVTLYGDGASYSTLDGNDKLIGGSASDKLVGGNGDDRLYGGAGSDVLYGDHETSNGTGGSDLLVGGTGSDQLYGGLGDDYFSFKNGDSAPSYYGSDVVKDFDMIHDHIVIEGGPTVTSSNYAEFKIANSSGNMYTDFSNAFSAADKYLDKYDYVFLTNGSQGYLFADVDYDGFPDLGIELKGLDSVSDFAQSSVVTHAPSYLLG